MTEAQGAVILRVMMTRGVTGWRDAVYVEYSPAPGESLVSEGALVTVYGSFAGLVSCTDLAGERQRLPAVLAERIE